MENDWDREPVVPAEMRIQCPARKLPRQPGAVTASLQLWHLHPKTDTLFCLNTRSLNSLSYTTNTSSSRGYKQLWPSVCNKHLFRTSPDFNQDSFMATQTAHLNSRCLDFSSSKTNKKKQKFCLLYHILKILTIVVTLHRSVHQINSVLLQIQSKV